MVLKELKSIGLTKYEARCFKALNKLKEGTASEIHEISGVPRSSVYGVLDRLIEKGLVEKTETRPVEFKAVNPEESLNKLSKRRRKNEKEALKVLKDVYNEDREESKGKIWTIKGEQNTRDKSLEIIRRSKGDIRIMDNPGLIKELEKDLKKHSGNIFIVTTADTDLPTLELEGEKNHPEKLNGFIVIGDKKVLVSFEAEKGRKGIYSDNESMIQLFKRFFEASVLKK